MKKLFMKVVTGLMALGCLMVGAGCFSPKLNIDTAEEALRAKDYEVEIDHDVHDGDFVVDGIIKKTLYAERDDMWIEIYEFEKAETAKLFYQMLMNEREADMQETKAYIEYYEHLLDDYKDKIKSDEIAELEDSIKEYKEDLEAYEEEEKTSGINGKYIWYASDIDVVEDAQ
jgi:hypothetical protein